jgi:hypothetical protein
MPTCRGFEPEPAATAALIHLFDDKGEPQADIAYTAHRLDGADPMARAGDLPVQRGPVLPLAGLRHCFQVISFIEHVDRCHPAKQNTTGAAFAAAPVKGCRRIQ